jgi:parallel beta-helix repeat protein/predicted outer membrane repeat protein
LIAIKSRFGACILRCALCILLILLCGCAEDPGTSDEAFSDTGSIAFSLAWQGSSGERSAVYQAAKFNCADNGVKWVKAQVLDENDQIIVEGPRNSDGWPCTEGKGTITGVPAGDNRRIVVLGLDPNKEVLYQGEKEGVRVIAGETAEAEITMHIFGPVWYVDAAVASSGDGKSWSQAFETIQEAIDAAEAGAGNEIWVKQGTYSLSDRIEANKAVAIYGGFAGGETQRAQRDWQDNVTTVDGQDSVNSCFYVTADANIDGFTITGSSGNIGTVGGAIQCSYDSGASPTIINCIFSGNSADNGGGIYTSPSSSATITNCVFSGNSAEYGGGIYVDSSSPIITSCTFSGNSTYNGGAIYIDADAESSPTVNDCQFRSNTAEASGGAFYSRSNSTPVISECYFESNRSKGGDGGGAVYNQDNSVVYIVDCTFKWNSSSNLGGAIFMGSGNDSVIVNSLFIRNNATNKGGAIANYDAANPTVTNCTFYNNYGSSTGLSISNNGSSPILVNSILWNDSQGPDSTQIWNGSGPMGDGSYPSVSYCDIRGGYNGENIDVDPLFVNREADDLNLNFGSPCIDAGSNMAPEIEDKDIEGAPRIADGNGDGTATVDIGAFEYQP